MYRAQYIWRNYQRPLIIAGVGGGVFYYINLEEVPISHRRRFNLLSPEAEKQIMGGDGVYKQVLAEFKGKILPSNHPLTKEVAHVVERLLPTTGGLAGDEWVVHVVDDPSTMNAFVMPGGKVFVFTGILKVCQNEAGLASVLSHEMAHNVAHHAAERLSRSGFTLLASMIFVLFLGIDRGISNSITQLVLEFPNSRTQEAEADHIGLLMMAEACYNPREAVAFWERMKKSEQLQPPQFLSTHPSHYNRAEYIKKLLPDAEAKFAEHGCSSMRHYTNEFKDVLAWHRLGKDGPIRMQQPQTRDDDDDFF
ncbi:uncharacterized protein Z518_03842 [Rhinocladiella mackenziei CBS 650.93]|uniref:Peptidase M48 domain-containing protein n=1 Tax=Rhinocladiella mackenziei CBS 650.93 TaxID=1442369 RepID=A0A0D2IJH2_9EURO|nr:uncharacterized protein Z518_03842 [Rhinocladiella mackenziei CBS 650.93]KIX05869.1 hypothetical protein Z518_03842 [Rhinocladiella mackenziei CBS 650.93]